MRSPAHRLLSLAIATALAAAASSMALAQDTTPPVRETPRPQDIDPAVNTSAPAAREASRPEDLEPAVDTSAPAVGKPQQPAPSAAAAASNEAVAAPAAPGATAAQPARPAARRGMDRLELDTTQITGNRELPKVLYIVPWKRSDLGDLVGRPVNSLLDEVLAPVDRDVFKRENRYYRALATTPDEGVGPLPTPPRPPKVLPSTSAEPAAGSVGSATKSSTGSGSAAPPTGDER